MIISDKFYYIKYNIFFSIFILLCHNYIINLLDYSFIITYALIIKNLYMFYDCINNNYEREIVNFKIVFYIIESIVLFLNIFHKFNFFVILNYIIMMLFVGDLALCNNNISVSNENDIIKCLLHYYINSIIVFIYICSYYPYNIFILELLFLFNLSIFDYKYNNNRVNENNENNNNSENNNIISNELINDIIVEISKFNKKYLFTSDVEEKKADNKQDNNNQDNNNQDDNKQDDNKQDNNQDNNNQDNNKQDNYDDFEII